MSPPDEQCVQSCLNGHPEAFRHLVERYQCPLMRCLRARLGNAEEATEAAQETFVRAYFALRKLRKPAAFFSWLLGIADRVAKETHRAAKRAPGGQLGAIEPAELPARGRGGRRHGGDGGSCQAARRLPGSHRAAILRWADLSRRSAAIWTFRWEPSPRGSLGPIACCGNPSARSPRVRKARCRDELPRMSRRTWPRYLEGLLDETCRSRMDGASCRVFDLPGRTPSGAGTDGPFGTRWACRAGGLSGDRRDGPDSSRTGPSA